MDNSFQSPEFTKIKNYKFKSQFYELVLFIH